MKRSRFVTLFLGLLFSTSSVLPAQDLNLVFYNVENLFDAVDDSLTNDNEFTPEGGRHWTDWKVSQKIHRIGQTLLAFGEGDLPSIVGLAEIENRALLERLCYDITLQNTPYQIVHKESPDHRGIDAAILFRSDKLTLLKSFFFYPDEAGATPSREMTCAQFQTTNNEILTVVICHWPSRYSGYSATQKRRESYGSFLKHKLDSLNNCLSSSTIIMGDFNDEPTGSSVKILTRENNSSVQYKNLSLDWNAFEGTLKYHGKWDFFDQIIVSENLLSEVKKQWYVQDSGVFTAPFLLEEDKKYLGVKPYRTFIGYKYQPGFSDHLPVFVRLKYRK